MLGDMSLSTILDWRTRRSGHSMRERMLTSVFPDKGHTQSMERCRCQLAEGLRQSSNRAELLWSNSEYHHLNLQY
jgi:hypothetical protein